MKMLLNQCLIGLSGHCNIFKGLPKAKCTKHLGWMITVVFVRTSQLVSEPVAREITGRNNPLYIKKRLALLPMLC
jgi:hypothetical protein